jgi:8-oxo-dGTP diphosphatase
MENSVFSGAKMAVLGKGQVLVLQRDDRAGLPHRGMWDLPGGAREFGETPQKCAVRETWEETRLMVAASDVVWQREYRNAAVPMMSTWFLVAKPGWLMLPVPKLGNEGQAVRWMAIEAFLELPDAIPHLKDRLRDYLVEASVAGHAVG